MREPDVFFVRGERQVEGDKPPNGADLVIEIVSPGSTNRERDLIAKRNDYAQASVAEYWIVDPDEQTVFVLSLDGQSYRTHGEFRPEAVATSLLLPKFQINVKELFESAL